jgi:hypothetical protein
MGLYSERKTPKEKLEQIKTNTAYNSVEHIRQMVGCVKVIKIAIRFPDMR